MALNTALHHNINISLPERRKITILGSTGSIGRNTVDLISKNLEAFQVEALVAQSNIDILADQAIKLQAKHVVIQDMQYYEALKERLENTSISVHAGDEAVLEICKINVDLVIAAIVGINGLLPTYTALSHAKIIAIANKESLVSAGHFIVQKAKDQKTILLPIDSEHNALSQIYEEGQENALKRFILTASGGPFWNMKKEQLLSVSCKQAIKHPNWSMGLKNSVDSATLMNKGLEIIETTHFFQIPEHKIDVVIHPQSIIHSMISFIDGSVLAHLSNPDMRIPISHCLSWPKRMAHNTPSLDIAALQNLTFYDPDHDKFPAINLCRAASRKGMEATAILNAANEMAVDAFAHERISFADITSLVEKTLEKNYDQSCHSVFDILALDQHIKKTLNNEIGSL